MYDIKIYNTYMYCSEIAIIYILYNCITMKFVVLYRFIVWGAKQILYHFDLRCFF